MRSSPRRSPTSAGCSSGRYDGRARHTRPATFIREHGAIPTSEGYKGYPKAICISPNDVVVHGIPDQFVVEDGNLVTIDVGVTLDGYIADSAVHASAWAMIEAESQRPADVGSGRPRGRDRRGGSWEPRRGRLARYPGLVEGAGFSVIRSLVGHGVGRYYHEDPHIPNFGEPGRGPRLSEGMTLAIEPMITAGSLRHGLDGRRLDDQDLGRLA